MLWRLIIGLAGLFSVGAQTTCCDPLKMACTAGVPLCSDIMMPQVTFVPSPSMQPTYFPLPAIETSITSAAMESTMTFGTCIMPAVDIAFVNTDYTVKYMMGRILNCCLKIPMTNIPIVYTQVNRPTIVVPLLTAGNWTMAVNPRLSVACTAAFASSSLTATRTPVPSTQVQMLTTSRPTVSTTMTISVTPTSSITRRVPPSGSATITPKVPPSETPSSTLRVVPSESATMTPRIIEKPSESSTMTPRVQEKPSESSTMTPRIQEPTPAPADVIMPPERPSESSTMTPKIVERPSESSTMTPKIVERPSESSTMTPKIVERPSESSTMTPRVFEKPSESSTMTPRVFEKPSESSTMTPRVFEKPSESSTMTPRVFEKPSESSTMTPRVFEKPSESSTMTPKMQEPTPAPADVIMPPERPSESSTMTPKTIVIERPSESSTMTPKIVERPSESSTMTPKTIIVERPSESSTPTSSVEESAHADIIERESESVTPRYIERPSQSNTMTPKIHETSPDVFIQPVDDSRVSSTPEQILEQPTKSPSSTKSQKIVPTLSSAPSRAPYRYPSMSVSRTVSPTKTVKYVRPSSSALPSRLPVPTKYVVLSPVPVTRRPTPTSIRTQKPAVVNSQLTINNGNVTYLSQPQTLQYIQASLACAAGVPLESIRILNITQRANGTQSEVLYDKGAPGLSSNGSAVCYRPKTTPTAKVGRRLQVVDESAVTVDYVIVDPPIEILDPVAFVAAVTGDSGLEAIMVEAGATNMDAVVPQEIVDYAAVASVGEPPVMVTENRAPIYIGAALGAGGLCGLVAAALLVMKARKRSAGKPLTRHVEVIEVNPTVRVIGGSERQIFVPGQVRV